jgi:hypothetical protein
MGRQERRLRCKDLNKTTTKWWRNKKRCLFFWFFHPLLYLNLLVDLVIILIRIDLALDCAGFKVEHVACRRSEFEQIVSLSGSVFFNPSCVLFISVHHIPKVNSVSTCTVLDVTGSGGVHLEIRVGLYFFG